MTDTVVSDAAVFPQDEGLPNIADGSESWGSAGHLSLLALATANGPFHYDGLGFTAHDATNDTVDVSAGISVLDLGSTSVSTQSALGGSSPPAYDTSLSRPGAFIVELPTATTLSMTASTLNPVWVAYATDGNVTNVSAGDVYLRHGSGETEPPHPSLKIGETNPDDATADFRAGFDNPPDSEGWREDPNSPFTQSVTGSTWSASLAGRYDVVKVEGHCWSDRAQDFGFGIQINGDATANYAIARDGDFTSSGLSEWGDVVVGHQSQEDTDGTAAASFALYLDADWNPTSPQPSATMVARSIHDDGGGVDGWDGGRHTGSIAPPLETIDFVPTNTTGFEVAVKGKHNGRPGTST